MNIDAGRQEEDSRTMTSTVVLYGSSWAECGYCKGSRATLVQRPTDASSQSYTIMCSGATLSPAWYETLIDNGWRRSGPAIYKPENWTSCCPLLSIRLPVQDFVASKSQRKILRKLAKLQSAPPPSTLPNDHQVQNDATSSNENHTKKKLKQQKSAHVPSSSTTPNLLGRHQNQKHWIEAKSGILEALSDMAVQSLPNIISTQYPTEMTDISSLTTSNKKKGAWFKLRTTKRPSASNEWIAATSICAAAAGPSRGKFDKGVLAKGLTAALLQQQSLVLARVKDGVDLSITKIEAHESSGQVLVHFNVTAAMTQQQNGGETFPAQTVGTSSVRNPAEINDAARSGDVLSNWWKKENPNEAPMQDRTITVSTVNVFDSCLDPQVHRLYAKYQHVVHNDADPFQDDLDAFFLSEREASGSDSVEEDPWQAFFQRNKDCLPSQQMQQSSTEDSASCNNNAWINQLKQMLLREYHHLPQKRQLRLSYFLTRFCEYYIASPFSTMRQTQSVPPFSSEQENASEIAANIPCGTYHQHYRINGRLIAVGVLDFLPRGLSSVYLIYMPSFSHQVMALGRYCALKEIEFCRDILKLPYYYLGYYLHSNQKMRYKGEYAPSQLLCPRHSVWVSADAAIPKLLSLSPTHHCASLVEEEGSDASDTVSVVDDIKLQVGGRIFSIRDLPPDGQSYLRPILEPFSSHAGSQASLECLVDLG